MGTTVNIFSSTGSFLGSGPVSADRTFSFNITLFGAGGTSFYPVATDSAGRSSPAGTAVTVIIDFKPTSVQTPTAEPGDTTVTLHWNPLPDADIAGYWIYRDGNPTPLNMILVDPTADQFTDIGLTNGRTYDYQVSAEDLAGQRGPLSPAVESSPQAGPQWGGFR
jgi:hypothetical protein